MKPDLLKALRTMTEPELYAALYCDHLTELLNRRALEQDGRQFVAIVDLDSLKYINDTSGYQEGDRVLCQAAAQLRCHFMPSQVYRLGGDEFAIKSDHGLQLRRALLDLRAAWPAFSFGIGTDLPAADRKLKQDKAARERDGQRASRGECPPWMGRPACLSL